MRVLYNCYKPHQNESISAVKNCCGVKNKSGTRPNQAGACHVSAAERRICMARSPPVMLRTCPLRRPWWGGDHNCLTRTLAEKTHSMALVLRQDPPTIH